MFWYIYFEARIGILSSFSIFLNPIWYDFNILNFSPPIYATHYITRGWHCISQCLVSKSQIYLSSSICVWQDWNPRTLYDRQGNISAVCPSLSRPNQTLPSCAETEIMKSLFACLQHENDTALTKNNWANPWWLSVHKVWVESVNCFGLQPKLEIFCKGLRDRTWHVPCATNRSQTRAIVFLPFQRIER